MIIFFIIVLFVVLVYLNIEYSLFIPKKKGLPILMYHKVLVEQNDKLIVSVDYLAKQFEYFKKKGYNVVSFKDLHENRLPKNPILLTFDDGFLNNKELLLPLLLKFNFRATFFIPTAYVGKVADWYPNDERILTVEELKTLVETGLVDIAIHGHNHLAMKGLPFNQIEDEIKFSIDFFEKNKIEYIPVLAYPYGSCFKTNKEHPNFLKVVEIFKKQGLWYALRIGNRINKLPIDNIYELKRIDIKGSDSFFIFKTKIKKGRAKLF